MSEGASSEDPAWRRRHRVSNDDRQKASDVFREREYLFGRKVGFEEAFPQLEHVEIEGEELGR